MSVYSPEYHAMIFSPGPARTEPRAESVTSTAVKSADAGAKGTDKDIGKDTGKDGEGFFDHLLDVINPLQHLPIIGTIYRAITGDKMGPIEKIAGDTLYGGMWGAITSIADVAFEGLTGKSFEDTALSLFKSDSKHTKVAAATPSVNAALPSAGALPAAVPESVDVAAFTSALSTKGVNGETANRALYAYRRSMSLVSAGQQPALASVH